MKSLITLLLLAAGLTGCTTHKETMYVRAVFMEMSSPPSEEQPAETEGAPPVERKPLQIFKIQEP